MLSLNDLIWTDEEDDVIDVTSEMREKCLLLCRKGGGISCNGGNFDPFASGSIASDWACGC